MANNEMDSGRNVTIEYIDFSDIYGWLYASFIHDATGSNLASTDRLMKAAGAKLVAEAYVG